MAKKKITELVDELLADFLKECGMELYHSEFVKEGKDWFLRVYIDTDGSQNQYVSTIHHKMASECMKQNVSTLTLWQIDTSPLYCTLKGFSAWGE